MFLCGEPIWPNIMPLQELPRQIIDNAGSHSGGDGGGTEDVVLCGLTTFPQLTLSVAQGHTGVRRWYLNCATRRKLKSALHSICESHWPGQKDCLPVAIQAGAPDEKANVLGNIGIDELSEKLELFDTYLIVAQYQLLHISDMWPVTGKPSHPQNTILTLQVRGGAEMLQVDPLAFLIGGEGRQLAPDPSFNCRIRIPLTEYHLTCDRVTDRELCQIMDRMSWKLREGTVNEETKDSPTGLFLNEYEGTLLFDTWTLDQTFVPDVKNPRRWRLSCVLKCRNVPFVQGSYPDNPEKTQYAVGWNHDFKLRNQKSGSVVMGWWFITMGVKPPYRTAGLGHELGVTPHGTCRDGQVPRYPYAKFSNIFCDERRLCVDAIPPARCIEIGPDVIEGQGVASSSSSAMDHRIAQIVEDSRHAAARKAVRDLERGIIDP